MPHDTVPDALGSRDPAVTPPKHPFLQGNQVPLHRRYDTFPALPKPIRSQTYNLDDVRHEQVCQRLDRIIELLERRPGMAATRWDMP